MLHTKTEGLLSNFFAGIGQKKKGEKLRMNWNTVIGSRGKCKIKQNKYMSKGEERVNNQVQKFYSYEELGQQVGYQQPPQQGYQQPMQQQTINSTRISNNIQTHNQPNYE